MAIKLLRVFSKIWVMLITLLILGSLATMWMQDGFGAVQQTMSPFNILNWIVTVVALSPGIAAHMLAERLESKREPTL